MACVARLRLHHLTIALMAATERQWTQPASLVMLTDPLHHGHRSWKPAISHRAVWLRTVARITTR